MKIVVLVVGLAISLFAFMQAQDISRISAFGMAFGNEDMAAIKESASFETVAAVLGGLGSGLIFFRRGVSIGLLAAAALSAAIASSLISDAGVYAGVYFILAIAQLPKPFLWGRRKRARPKEEDENTKLS